MIAWVNWREEKHPLARVGLTAAGLALVVVGVLLLIGLRPSVELEHGVALSFDSVATPLAISLNIFGAGAALITVAIAAFGPRIHAEHRTEAASLSSDPDAK